MGTLSISFSKVRHLQQPLGEKKIQIDMVSHEIITTAQNSLHGQLFTFQTIFQPLALSSSIPAI